MALSPSVRARLLMGFRVGAHAARIISVRGAHAERASCRPPCAWPCSHVVAGLCSMLELPRGHRPRAHASSSTDCNGACFAFQCAAACGRRARCVSPASRARGHSGGTGARPMEPEARVARAAVAGAFCSCRAWATRCLYCFSHGGCGTGFSSAALRAPTLGRRLAPSPSAGTTACAGRRRVAPSRAFARRDAVLAHPVAASVFPWGSAEGAVAEGKGSSSSVDVVPLSSQLCICAPLQPTRVRGARSA